MTQTDYIKVVVTHDRQERQPITGIWLNGGLSGYFNILPRINFCGCINSFVLRNPLLRKALDRV